MNVLADNVFQMTNAELIGLAKNRFLDHETQDKIACCPDRADWVSLETTSCNLILGVIMGRRSVEKSDFL